MAPGNWPPPAAPSPPARPPRGRRRSRARSPARPPRTARARSSSSGCAPGRARFRRVPAGFSQGEIYHLAPDCARFEQLVERRLELLEADAPRDAIEIAGPEIL